MLKKKKNEIFDLLFSNDDSAITYWTSQIKEKTVLH